MSPQNLTLPTNAAAAHIWLPCLETNNSKDMIVLLILYLPMNDRL